MTQAVAVRREGDTFQARLFWMKALCLLDPFGPIERVGFEIGPKGFDDIWVEYDPNRSPLDQEGNPLLREHIQAKWHVAPGDYTHAELIDPEFINATSQSLLQRARQAQLSYAPAGVGARFKLVSNWHVNRSDALRPMIYQRSGTLRLDRLFGTQTDQSAAGRIRKLWRDHLEIDEAELRILARTLAFGTATASLDDLRFDLDPLLALAGLRRIPFNESTFSYDDLVFQWLGQGRLDFSRSTFRTACLQEGLFAKAGDKRIVFGVKSFEHAFDRLEDRCSKTLDLIQHFDERPIRPHADWQTTLYPQLKEFLLGAARENEHLRLVLDTHATLAFAAGTILNIKSGRAVELEQRTIQRQVWQSNDVESNPAWPTWTFEEQALQAVGTGIAVAVSLTHDIADDVKTFANRSLPDVGRLLIARLNGGAGSQSVASGRHAFDLAEALAVKMKKEKSQDGALMHLFIAAPNAFTFFLGQRQPGLGRLVTYEFDFEGQNGGGYTPSLSLPVPTSAA